MRSFFLCPNVLQFLLVDQEQLVQQVKRNRELIEENRKILKHIDRRGRWASIFSIVRIVIVVVVALGIYVYLEPIFEAIMNIYIPLVQTFGLQG